MKTNDREYWDRRFSTDWMDFGGDKQTSLFARMLLDNMPVDMARDIEDNNLKIVDFGCAQGECAAMMKKRFPGSSVGGVDFSRVAVDIASKKFPQCDFAVRDIKNDDVKCDVAVCSNVLEHLEDPNAVVARLCSNAARYVVLMVPFRESPDSGIAEHVNKFRLADFGNACEGLSLSFVRVVNPMPGCEGLWPYKQLLAIYERAIPGTAWHSSTGDLSKVLAELREGQLEHEEQLEKGVAEVKNALCGGFAESAAGIANLQKSLDRFACDSSTIATLRDTIATLREELAAEKASGARLAARLRRYEMAEDAVVKYIGGFTANGSASILNLLKRLRYQVLGGGWRGKRDFVSWVRAGFARKNVPDARFNPFWDIYDTTRRTFEVSRRPDGVVEAEDKASLSRLSKASTYRKFDVLFFSVIDYDFRYQRPQQIADYYAKKGHRVFYFNVNFGVGDRPAVKNTHENLYEVTLNFGAVRSVHTSGFGDVLDSLKSQVDGLLREYFVLDSIAMCEYPNWIDAVKLVRHTHSMAVVVDYLDDWDGFKDTASKEVMENTEELMAVADCVIASSQYLADKAAKRSRNVSLVRNGTEFAHFNRVCGMRTGVSGRKKIGYYGAISHWFDIEKVAAVAKARPDVDIELVGAVSVNAVELERLPNVKFYGERPYSDLPELIRDWQVCLIPFDTSTSLIRATNPVKFYEYLSAGKKIVATEIPEIEEYAGKYALLANDTEKFVEYVGLCLDGKDGLASEEERAKLARENDWERRLAAINRAVEGAVPKISVVVLTYNQPDYTRLCIESILKWTAYPNYELIVVDNASQADTRDYLKSVEAKYPRVKVILNDKNLGFAGGNNVGLRAASGEYLVLLNNDTVVPRGWLSRFLAHFRSHPRCGAAGAVSNSIGNEAMVPVGYASLPEFLEESSARAFEHAFECGREEGCLAMFCFAFPRCVLEQIGPISEEYGRGMFEDDDYCMAIHRAGLTTEYLEDVLVHHFLSVSFDACGSEEKLALHRRNRETFERKWNTKWVLHPFRKGVDWTTNSKTTAAFPELVRQGAAMANPPNDSESPFADGDFDLAEFIALRRADHDYAGVYVLPSVWWDVPIFQRSQQMAMAFARRNYLVLYFEMPSEKYAAGSVRSPVRGCYVFTVSDFEKAVESVSGCIVSIYSTAFEICRSGTKFPTADFLARNYLVYEYIDHFNEKISGSMTKGLRDFYSKITVSAGRLYFLASARALQAELSKRTGRDVIYVANGVDVEHYSRKNINDIAKRVRLPGVLRSSRPKIGYFGAIAPWLDYDLIRKLAEQNPEWEFVFIGPDYGGGADGLPRRTDNFHWIGPVSYLDLPYYADSFDVAILPFCRGDIARSTSPLKLFEYFALGKPVVVTPDMEECRQYAEVLVGGGADGFSAAIRTALERSKDPACAAALRKLAEDNSWDARAEALVRGLGLHDDEPEAMRYGEQTNHTRAREFGAQVDRLAVGEAK